MKKRNLCRSLRRASTIAVLSALPTVIGCVGVQPTPSRSVRTAASGPHETGTPSAATVFEAGEQENGFENVIAVANGIPITRARVIELLLRAHGAGLLEQLIGLELAGQLAAQRGLSVSEADVELEYALALRRLTDPLAMVTPADFDRETAERVLESVLDERNISREEFLITIRRNAYLRKIVTRDLVVSEADLRAEYDRVHGVRAEVRHIQLGSDGDVRRVMERLSAGDDFDALAARFSANIASAERGGLLEPFSGGDEGVPEQFRKTAFSLTPREVSDVIHVGEWRHLIRLERIIEADERGLNAVRRDLEAQLRGRLAEERMQSLFSQLLREAKIDIRDPNVRAAFDKRREGQP